MRDEGQAREGAHLTWAIAGAALCVLAVALAYVATWRPAHPASVDDAPGALPDTLSAASPGPSAASRGPAMIEPPAVRGMPPSAPVRVTVPTLDIESSLVHLRLDAGGSLQVPDDYSKAGWYVDGPFPGKANGPPALIVGHVDSTTGPAVFFSLRDIEKGAEVRVDREDSATAVFRVVSAKQYPKTSLPVDELYAPRQPAELVLITCTGEFDEQTNSYLDNFVVTARLDREASGLGA